MESVRKQTFKDYELLCYHDGPLTDPTVELPVPVRCTPARHNDWGHSLRDLGIHEATGDYIVHFNADNVLYPDALATIAAEIARPPRLKDQNGRILDTNDIVIFPIRMFGLAARQRQGGAIQGKPAVLHDFDREPAGGAEY